jgi:predicted  nucleic acid-binding Zn-ribbon protein
MARWQPHTPLENLQGSLKRINTRIEGKRTEIRDLEEQKKQVEQAIAALSKK